MNKNLISGRRLAILAVAVVTLGAGYWYSKVGTANSGSAAKQPEPAPVAPPVQEATENSTQPQEAPALQVTAAPQSPAVVQAATHPVGAAPLSPKRPEPSSYTRELVAGIVNLDPTRGSITEEQAEQWKQRLATLVQQGVAAVPAIGEFLEQNQELNFSAFEGGQLLGQPSLRTALIDALRQIGGPEATSAMLETLQTTTLPSEIALLARYLEEQTPGEHRQAILSAAQDVIAMADKDQLPGWDVGALFQVLQSYGDSSTTAALQQLQLKWNYYATMSLAGMQGGEGMPNLIRQAQDPTADGRTRDHVFQMLAQVATRYPDAAGALLEQAQSNQIPGSAWRKIVAGLAGDQYGIGSPPNLNPITKTLPGLKGYHIVVGNQNFYSLPLSATLPSEEINQRIALLDQLRGHTQDTVAVQALQTARESLASRMSN
jgi:hypothetical protein